MLDHLVALRADYERQAGRSLALPIAGAVVWTIVGIAALFLPQRTANLVLLFGSGTMFPLAMLLSQPLGESLIGNTNPLAKLMGMSVLMVNLLWAVHFTVVFLDPQYLPLTLGIGLGLHWIVFSWVIGHPIGTIHAILRTGLVTLFWWLFPESRLTMVSLGVVIAYATSIFVLATRKRGIRQPEVEPA